MKKINLLTRATALIMAAALSSPALANEGSTNSLSGFYVGGFGGHTWVEPSLGGGSSSSLNGSDYGLFAGYQMENTLGANAPFNLSSAIEGSYGWNAHTHETGFIGALPVSIEKNHDWGVSFRPGLSFLSSSAMLGLHPYGILGYRQAEFSASSVGSSNHGGFDLGIGTELIAYKNFGIRLDYDHVFYQAKDGLDPKENDLRLGVAYHF